ncbi:hypothetical protein KGM_200099 [Danaus plexippus plexippus]|uniref:Uncharacterized protein n=1 Tax=Danaus plexippus plexippus TaxID=278856 RepID=A0A212EXK6_DANPL|nr:hypothetical protein KGM_200099 [Danaus plexippus plexippus]
MKIAVAPTASWQVDCCNKKISLGYPINQLFATKNTRIFLTMPSAMKTRKQNKKKPLKIKFYSKMKKSSKYFKKLSFSKLFIKKNKDMKIIRGLGIIYINYY